MTLVDLPGGATLHVIDTGTPAGVDDTRPPVVLIHGMLGTPQTQLPTLLDWLRRDYRVIAPTLRGYGDSLPKPRRFPADFYQRDARDVLELLDHLNLPPAHLLGYSDGGEAALLLAGTAADRLRSVVVWGAVGFYGPQMRPAAQRMFPATWITDEQKTLHGFDNADAFVLEWIQSVRRIIDSGGDLSLSLVGQMRAPLMLMLGTQDRLNPVEYGQRLVDAAPDARLQTFDCGHAIHDEAWPAFQATVRAFLNTHN
jgi:valacyclovir hydrolase